MGDWRGDFKTLSKSKSASALIFFEILLQLPLEKINFLLNVTS